MLKENISLSQLLTLNINFLLGSTIVLGIGTEAKNDAWIAIGVASILGVGLIGFYHKCVTLLPGKNLYQILEYCFGRKVSMMLAIFIVHTLFIFLAV